MSRLKTKKLLKLNCSGMSSAAVSTKLLRAVLIRPCDEFPGDGLAELHAGVQIDLKMNSRPNAGIASLFRNRTNFIRVRRKQVSQHFAPSCRVGGVIRGIAREIR